MFRVAIDHRDHRRAIAGLCTDNSVRGPWETAETRPRPQTAGWPCGRTGYRTRAAGGGDPAGIYFRTTAISTRRFRRLPVLVLLLATGLLAPIPTVWMFSARMPLATMYFLTSAARASERCMLLFHLDFTILALSVWPYTRKDERG